MKTLQEFKIISVPLTLLPEISNLVTEADSVLSSPEMVEFLDFVTKPQFCNVCGIANRFRAAEGSNLCADCFFR